MLYLRLTQNCLGRPRRARFELSDTKTKLSQHQNGAVGERTVTLPSCGVASGPGPEVGHPITGILFPNLNSRGL